MNKKLVSFILLILFLSCTGNQDTGKDQSRIRKKRKAGLFVVTKIARIQSEPSAFSPLAGILKFKARVEVMGFANPWVLIHSHNKEIEGYVHFDSLMPLRKIKQFLKNQEISKLEKKEDGVKSSSEEDEMAAGTKGFSEEEEITAGTKGFSEEEEITAGTKGLNHSFEEAMQKEKPHYRYDLLKGFIKHGKMLNPYRKLKKFRRKRKIGEFYHPVNKGKLEKIASKGMEKRFDKRLPKHHDGFLPLEEYYIGRTTAAHILSSYEAYGDGGSKLEHYINNIVRTLGMTSSRPEVFKGYRVIILKSDKKNAFANPGGFIFITTGLLKLANYEDEIAGVLAHEVAHIALRHPTKSIILAHKEELAKNHPNSRFVQNMKKRMSDSVDDMFQKMKTGMDTKQEQNADLHAVHMLMRVGYEPMGLVRIIKKLKKGDEVHGDPDERANNLKRFIQREKRRFGLVTRVPKYRRTVYHKALKELE